MVDLEEIRRYLITSLGRYRGHEEYEDGFQEGMIRAWRDIQDGHTEFLHVAHRAKLWAVNYILDSGNGRRRATGAPPMSRNGRNDSQGEKSREKIRQYVSEYVKLHGSEPTNKQVANGTGLSSAVVSHQRKNMREGKGFNHALYTTQYGEKRIDYSAYKSTAITDDNRDFIFSFHKVEFEKEVIDNMDFVALLEKVDVNHRNVLYWHHVLGLNAKEISQRLGLSGGSTTGSRRIKSAHEAVLAIVDPDKHGQRCRNGHLRTSDNTITSVRSDGQLTNLCLDCKEDKRKRQAARRKPTSGRSKQTHCKNGHEIRGFKSGRRYCKICNKLNQYPGMTVKDIPADSKLWNWDKQ